MFAALETRQAPQSTPTRRPPERYSAVEQLRWMPLASN